MDLLGNLLGNLPNIPAILPGSRVAWDYEPCDPESGPSGYLDTMEGTVILCGQLYGGRGFWVAADDGSRQLVLPSWIVPPAELSRREAEFQAFWA